MLAKIVIYNSQNYTGILGADLETIQWMNADASVQKYVSFPAKC